MPTFSVKKVQEGPDPGEEPVEINVPNEIFSKILLMLDGPGLHAARQVCQEWNSVIKEQVLGSVEGRREMEKILLHQWREAAPARSEFNIGGFVNPHGLSLTDQFAVIYGANLHLTVTVINTREGSVVLELSESDGVGLYPRALIFKNVFLLVSTRGFRECEVLAWNILTKEKIFTKKFPFDIVEVDEHNHQVMVRRHTRLVVTGTAVIETNQAPLPGDRELLAFSHPHYLTGSRSYSVES